MAINLEGCLSEYGTEYSYRSNFIRNGRKYKCQYNSINKTNLIFQFVQHQQRKAKQKKYVEHLQKNKDNKKSLQIATGLSHNCFSFTLF